MAIKKSIQPEVVEEEKKEEKKPKLLSYKTTTLLNFREKPNKEAKVLEVLPAGTVIKVESSTAGWAKCVYNDKAGYVMEEYIKPAK